MSAGGSTTTTQKADPWGPAQSNLMQALGRAEGTFKRNKFAPQPYMYDRVAGFGDVSQDAQSMMIDRAQGGSPLIDQAQGTFSNMMSGDYQSDMLDRVKNEALGSAIPAAVAQFSGSGMTNSSQAMDTVGRAATNAIAPIEYGAFEASQNRAMDAARMSPSMDQAGYLPAQMLGQVGGMQDQMAQSELNAKMARYNEIQNRERENLQGYLNAVMGIAGQGSSSTATEPGPSAMQSIGSAGLSGLGTYGALAMNPATAPFAAIGGIGAGLLGLF